MAKATNKSEEKAEEFINLASGLTGTVSSFLAPDKNELEKALKADARGYDLFKIDKALANDLVDLIAYTAANAMRNNIGEFYEAVMYDTSYPLAGDILRLFEKEFDGELDDLQEFKDWLHDEL